MGRSAHPLFHIKRCGTSDQDSSGSILRVWNLLVPNRRRNNPAIHKTHCPALTGYNNVICLMESHQRGTLDASQCRRTATQSLKHHPNRSIWNIGIKPTEIILRHYFSGILRLQNLRRKFYNSRIAVGLHYPMVFAYEQNAIFHKWTPLAQDISTFLIFWMSRGFQMESGRFQIIAVRV